MSDIITTLNKKGDRTVNVYPNIKQANIPANAVDSSKLASNSVTTGKIDNKAVTTAKLDNSAVTTDKINDGAVTTNKLNDSSVTTDKIVDHNVTSDKMSPTDFSPFFTNYKIEGDTLQADVEEIALYVAFPINIYSTITMSQFLDISYWYLFITRGYIKINSSQKYFPIVSLTETGSNTFTIYYIDYTDGDIKSISNYVFNTTDFILVKNGLIDIFSTLL